MAHRKRHIIDIDYLDNGVVVTMQENYTTLAKFYCRTVGEAIEGIANELNYPDVLKDDPHPYTEGLEGRELTDSEVDGMNEEMKEIRTEHLERGLKTGSDLFNEAQEKEFKNDKETRNTEENSNE